MKSFRLKHRNYSGVRSQNKRRHNQKPFEGAISTYIVFEDTYILYSDR